MHMAPLLNFRFFFQFLIRFQGGLGLAWDIFPIRAIPFGPLFILIDSLFVHIYLLLMRPIKFPSSRGLSRRDKLKREERDLCQLPTSFLSRMPSRFLNIQWRFCRLWHNPENRFEFERERERECERLLNLSARSNLNGPIRVEDETILRAAVVVDPVLYELFDRRSTRIWSEIYRVLWNCWFYCDSGLFFLRRKWFVEWRLASDGWSGFPANRGFSRRSKNERFAIARREKRKRIAS